MTLWNRFQCWRKGHDFYVDDCGAVLYRFCHRCDREGELVVDLIDAGLTDMSNDPERLEEYRRHAYPERYAS
jgi:hypothetical protein